MTYKNDEYYKLDRNHTRARSMLNIIDKARTFNHLTYVERLTIRGVERDGTPIEVEVSGQLMKAILDRASTHCVDAAKRMSAEALEEVDLDKAAQV